MLGHETHRKFELVMQVRDKKGNPTGKVASVNTDNINVVVELFRKLTYSHPRNLKANNKPKEKLPSPQEAATLLKTVNDQAEAAADAKAKAQQ